MKQRTSELERNIKTLQQKHDASKKEYENKAIMVNEYKTQTKTKHEKLKQEFDTPQIERNEIQKRYQSLSNEYEVSKAEIQQLKTDIIDEYTYDTFNTYLSSKNAVNANSLLIDTKHRIQSGINYEVNGLIIDNNHYDFVLCNDCCTDKDQVNINKGKNKVLTKDQLFSDDDLIQNSQRYVILDTDILNEYIYKIKIAYGNLKKVTKKEKYKEGVHIYTQSKSISNECKEERNQINKSSVLLNRLLLSENPLSIKVIQKIGDYVSGLNEIKNENYTIMENWYNISDGISPIRDITHPTNDITRDPIKDPTKDPTKDLIKDPTRDTTKDPTHYTTSDPTKDPTRDAYATKDPTHYTTKEIEMKIEEAIPDKILIMDELYNVIKKPRSKEIDIGDINDEDIEECVNAVIAVDHDKFEELGYYLRALNKIGKGRLIKEKKEQKYHSEQGQLKQDMHTNHLENYHIRHHPTKYEQRQNQQNHNHQMQYDHIQWQKQQYYSHPMIKIEATDDSSKDASDSIHFVTLNINNWENNDEIFKTIDIYNTETNDKYRAILVTDINHDKLHKIIGGSPRITKRVAEFINTDSDLLLTLPINTLYHQDDNKDILDQNTEYYDSENTKHSIQEERAKLKQDKDYGHKVIKEERTKSNRDKDYDEKKYKLQLSNNEKYSEFVPDDNIHYEVGRIIFNTPKPPINHTQILGNELLNMELSHNKDITTSSIEIVVYDVNDDNMDISDQNTEYIQREIDIQHVQNNKDTEAIQEPFNKVDNEKNKDNTEGNEDKEAVSDTIDTEESDALINLNNNISTSAQDQKGYVIKEIQSKLIHSEKDSSKYENKDERVKVDKVIKLIKILILSCLLCVTEYGFYDKGNKRLFDHYDSYPYEDYDGVITFKEINNIYNYRRFKNGLLTDNDIIFNDDSSHDTFKLVFRINTLAPGFTYDFRLRVYRYNEDILMEYGALEIIEKNDDMIMNAKSTKTEPEEKYIVVDPEQDCKELAETLDNMCAWMVVIKTQHNENLINESKNELNFEYGEIGLRYIQPNKINNAMEIDEDEESPYTNKRSDHQYYIRKSKNTESTHKYDATIQNTNHALRDKRFETEVITDKEYGDNERYNDSDDSEEEPKQESDEYDEEMPLITISVSTRDHLSTKENENEVIDILKYWSSYATDYEANIDIYITQRTFDNEIDRMITGDTHIFGLALLLFYVMVTFEKISCISDRTEDKLKDDEYEWI